MAQPKPKRFLSSFEDIERRIVISVQHNTAIRTNVRALRKIFVLALLTAP